MQPLELLGTALGLGALAGINLYLTVFVTGLAIQQGWILLAPQYSTLSILSEPAIILIAGTLYFLEFFADKVPWVDSLWDTVHTVIRPIGAAFLGIQVLGQSAPVFDVVIALAAGSAGLATHSLKATTRLVANGSPEPFSNIALSLFEDISVLGGLALVHFHPVLMLLVVLLLVAFVIITVPKLFGIVRVKAWLIWKKLNSLGDAELDKSGSAPLPIILPPDADILLHAMVEGNAKVEWAVPCVNGGSKQAKGNVFGFLVATSNTPEKLHFVPKGKKRKNAETFEISPYRIQHESKLLSENLILYSVNHHPKRVFIFDRSRRGLVAKLASALAEQIVKTSTV
jgi:hypothetical protein